MLCLLNWISLTPPLPLCCCCFSCCCSDAKRIVCFHIGPSIIVLSVLSVTHSACVVFCCVVFCCAVLCCVVLYARHMLCGVLTLWYRCVPSFSFTVSLFEFFLLFYRVYVYIEICVSVCVPFFLFSRVLTVNGLRSILINGAPNTIFLFEHCANVILTPFVESDCRTVLCIGRQAYSIRCVCIFFSLLVASLFR